MSSKTQCAGTIGHQNRPAPARTISARRVKTSARIALALALAALGILRSAWAEGPVQSYAIPAGPVQDALMDLAAQADLKLIFKTDFVRSAHSAGLTATLTPERGVARLLEGSGIAHRFVDSNTVTIEPEAPLDPLERLVAEAGKPMEYAGATEPAPKKPKAPVGRSEYGPTVLPEMTVTATYGANDPYNTDYNRQDATTATKTDTPIMETPVSIQVVPRQVLQDQQATRVEDAVKNVSGVQSSFNYGDEGYDFFIRGFNTDYSAFHNGFRAGDGLGTPGIANVERIEVLKGPAAVLYGRIEPGGLINLVSKRPLFSPYYSIQQQFGSYDLYRTTLDAAGPLLSDSSLAYRFNFEYLDKNFFRDFVYTERIFVAPSLTWRPREDTEVNLLVEYAHVNGSEDQGIPAIGNRPAPLPISRSLVGSNNNQTSDDTQLYLTASHQLNEAWTVRGGFSGYWFDYTYDYLYHDTLLDDDRTLSLLPIPFDPQGNSYAIYLDTTGKFET
ncbi:MAG: TonB-dependent siderophore receptor, partial [Gammaproteobacteria bacterium]